MSGRDEGGTLSDWQKHSGTLETPVHHFPEKWTLSGSNTAIFDAMPLKSEAHKLSVVLAKPEDLGMIWTLPWRTSDYTCYHAAFQIMANLVRPQHQQWALNICGYLKSRWYMPAQIFHALINLVSHTRERKPSSQKALSSSESGWLGYSRIAPLVHSSFSCSFLTGTSAQLKAPGAFHAQRRAGPSSQRLSLLLQCWASPVLSSSAPLE